jgi:hypothetical protein
MGAGHNLPHIVVEVNTWSASSRIREEVTARVSKVVGLRAYFVCTPRKGEFQSWAAALRRRRPRYLVLLGSWYPPFPLVPDAVTGSTPVRCPLEGREHTGCSRPPGSLVHRVDGFEFV